MDLSSLKGTPSWVTVAEENLLLQENGDAMAVSRKSNHQSIIEVLVYMELKIIKYASEIRKCIINMN